MKKIKTLGIVTALFIIIIMAAAAFFLLFGTNGKIEGMDGIITEKEESEKSPFLWQTEEIFDDVIAKIETEAGEITLKIAPGSIGEKFIGLCESGALNGVEFSVLAENMFIQANPSGENSPAEKTDYACFNGAVAFVMDEGEASSSFIIITAKELSGASKAYLSENEEDEQKAALYKKHGGIPEYEGKVFVFGMVTFGWETVDSIAAGENSGYTGGYAAKNPVKIISAKIIYPEEQKAD